MPRQGQIQPSYLVPHVMTVINNNTVFEDRAASSADDSVRLLCVFASPKGKDGIIQTFDNRTDYLEEFGIPNYTLYGQPGYMPYTALESGFAKVACMRIMPDNATYSNTIIIAKVKPETVTTGELPNQVTTKHLLVKLESIYIDNLTDPNSLALEMGALAKPSPDVDDEGFSTYPIIGLRCKGRGKYGNTLRTRFVTDKLSDADNEFKNYIVEILDSEKGLVKKETFRSTLNPESIVSRISLFLDDVLNDSDEPSKLIESYVDSINLSEIYNLYLDQLSEEEKKDAVPYESFDFLTGTQKDNKKIPHYSVDADSLPLDRTDGILLSGGIDGSFSAETSIANREAAMDTEYIKAFEGAGKYADSGIKSKRRVPCELILDANYSMEVKRAMATLAINRYDARCILDAGILSTVTQVNAWMSEVASIHDQIISKECQHYKIRDPFNGKTMPVTATYFIAQYLPPHYRVFGNQVPFVGEQYAKLNGHVKNSLKPVIDADDLAIKDQLYTGKVNFFECIAEDNFIRGVQITSDAQFSDMSEENNVAVMLEMKRKIEEYVASKIYNFAEAEDRKRFTEDGERMFAEYRGRKLREFTISFDMNKWEEERSILHCYLSVIFRTMAKRGIVEIDINKRV